MWRILTDAVPYADITLIVQISGSAMRWGLSEGTRVEVWRGTQLLGTLSGETLRQLVAQHLSTMAIVSAMHTTLSGGAPLRDEAAAPIPLPERPPPSKDMFTPAGRQVRRDARKTRRKPPGRLP